MAKKLFLSTALGCGLTICGCGPSEKPNASVVTPSKSSAPATTAAVNVPPDSTVPAETPGAAVTQFLEHARAGDDRKACGLLTSKARQKTAEYQMSIAPPGSPDAKFEIVAEEVMPDDKLKAQVGCKVTDKEEDGTVRTDSLVWLVCKEPAGWRVSGMASKVFPDAPPLILNFEDPEDMTRKQQLVEQEMQRREAATKQTATTGAPQQGSTQDAAAAGQTAQTGAATPDAGATPAAQPVHQEHATAPSSTTTR